jgi:hypothetical protein
MAAVGVMLLALCSLMAGAFCFVAGSNWLGLALIAGSTVLEAFAFFLVGREEAEG